MEGIGAALWRFVLLFSFIWIILFASEPEWVKDENGDVSKVKCSMWAIIGAFVLAIAFWILYYRAYYDKSQEYIRSQNSKRQA